jgi:uncharacterized protein
VTWFRWDGADLVLLISVQPRTRECAFAGVQADRLKVRLTAPPVDGKANEALVTYLAGQFGVPRRQVTLEQGETGRQKRLRIHAPRTLPPELSLPKPSV